MGKLYREFSSGGIVIKSHGPQIKILLIKDPYEKWTWPKGNIDKGESSLNAATREIEEETGLKNIQMLSKVGQINYFYKREKRLIYKTVYLYLFKFKGREALSIQKTEIEDGRWFSKEEALSRVGYKGAKDFLRKAIRLYGQHGMVDSRQSTVDR
jgi:8-oxo-dGTP diphosphatase